METDSIFDFFSAMESAYDVICILDEEGNFVKVSPSSKTVWGYNPDDLKHKSYKTFVVPEDLEKTDQKAEQILKGTNCKNFENRFFHKNGHIVYNLWSAYYSKTKKQMVCIARDISHIKANNEKLRLFESALNQAKDTIIITDSQLAPPGPRIVYANPAFEKNDRIFHRRSSRQKPQDSARSKN
jgi:PAS domain S-box-containing protein